MIIESNLKKGELKSIAKVLMKMQENKNKGEGVPYIRDIAKLLKKGKIIQTIEMVKKSVPMIYMFPDINRFVHDVIYPIGYIDSETGLILNPEE